MCSGQSRATDARNPPIPGYVATPQYTNCCRFGSCRRQRGSAAHRPPPFASASPMGAGRKIAAGMVFRSGGDSQPCVCLSEDVAIEVDSGGDLRDHRPVRCQPHHAALGHVGHVLTLRDRAASRERHLLNLLDDLAVPAFAFDSDAVAGDRHRGARLVQAGEHEPLRPRGDVNEAAGTPR